MLDAVSEAKLAEVNPELARRVRQLADLLSFPIIVTQGMRSYAKQDALYALGRTVSGAIVTNAKGGYSMHQFGLAVDVAPLGEHGVDWDGKDAKWQEILAKALSCGLAEGAAWRTFPDEPHLYPQEVQATPDDNIRYLFLEGGALAVWNEILPTAF